MKIIKHLADYIDDRGVSFNNTLCECPSCGKQEEVLMMEFTCKRVTEDTECTECRNKTGEVKKQEEEEREKFGGFTKKELLDKINTIDDDDPNMCLSCGA